MSLMFGKLYEALRAAPGITETQAQEAAVEMASFAERLTIIERNVAILTWMVGTNLVVSLGLLWQIIRLGEAVARLRP